MKRILSSLLFLLLSGLMFAEAFAADNPSVLYVHLKDGGMIEFVLPVQQPAITYLEGVMHVDYLAEDGSQSSVSYDRDEVSFLSIGQGGILDEVVPLAESTIQFDLTRVGMVHVSGLAERDRLQVFRPDGKQAKAGITRNGSEATVDLSREPRGIYLVSVNNRFTFKLMKP